MEKEAKNIGQRDADWGGPPAWLSPITHTGHHHLFGTARPWGSPVSKGPSLSFCLSVNKCEFVKQERVRLSVGAARGGSRVSRDLSQQALSLCSRQEGSRFPHQGTGGRCSARKKLKNRECDSTGYHPSRHLWGALWPPVGSPRACFKQTFTRHRAGSWGCWRGDSHGPPRSQNSRSTRV